MGFHHTWNTDDSADFQQLQTLMKWKIFHQETEKNYKKFTGRPIDQKLCNA